MMIEKIKNIRFIISLKSHIVFMFCLALLFVKSGIAQHAQQEYIYLDKSIRFIISSNKIKFTDTETVEFKIKIKNISSRKILLFKEPYFKFLIQEPGDTVKKKFDKIFLEFGGTYAGGTSTWQEMIMIEPSEVMHYKLFIPIKSLLDKNYSQYLNLQVRIGYIDDVKKVKNIDQSFQLKTIIEKNIYKIDSSIVDLLLYREFMEAFGIFIK